MLSVVVDWLKPQKKTFEGTSGRTYLQQGSLSDPTKSTEFYDSSGSLVSVLNALRPD